MLMSLCDTPFEPLSTCEMKFLTWKTVFLVALATASRVSEIHALSLDSQHLRFEKDGICLLPNLKFLAKTQRLGKPWSAMFVPEFNTYATDCRDLLLCPCRAVKMYLKRTKSLRKGEEALFLTYKSGQQHKASKHSIARWIVSLIQFVCEKTGKLFYLHVRTIPDDYLHHGAFSMGRQWKKLSEPRFNFHIILHARCSF